MCGLFCSNQSEVPLKFGYLAHIIRVISTALNSNIQSTISMIMRKTKYIFSLDYKGLLLLIPIYLLHLQEILKSSSPFEDKVKSAAVSILGSLLCFPDRFLNYKITSIVKGVPKMEMEEIREKLQEILWSYIETFKVNITSSITANSSAKVMRKVICCANIMIYQEAGNRQSATLKVIPLLT